MAEYRVNTYVARGASRSPVPEHSVVFIRRINPELPSIYMVNVGARGQGYTWEHFDGNSRTIYTGPLNVDTRYVYAAAWAPERERAALIEAARGILTNRSGSPYLVQPNQRDREAHRLVVEQYAATVQDSLNNFRSAVVSTLSEMGLSAEANNASSADARRLIEINRNMIQQLGELSARMEAPNESLITGDPIYLLRDRIIAAHPELNTGGGLPGHNPAFIRAVNGWREQLSQQVIDLNNQLQSR